MQKITKLVLPVAGLGKRLLPLTKNLPKALVAASGKPLLEYVLEEAVSAGIKEVVLVINPRHAEHFKTYLKKGRKRFPELTFHVRVQDTPGGNGHAVVQAFDIIGNKPFAVRFCDDIVAGDPPALQSLIKIFDERRGSVVLLERVPKKLIPRFGVVAIKGGAEAKKIDGGNVYQIMDIIEKPKAKDAPSNLTIVGGYVLSGDVIKNLKRIANTLSTVLANDALPIAVALQIELIIGGKIYGWEFPGTRLDCGTLEKLRQAEAFLNKKRK